jgi:hypothetical protein
MPNEALFTWQGSMAKKRMINLQPFPYQNQPNHSKFGGILNEKQL